jgi:chorismate dehydratase
MPQPSTKPPRAKAISLPRKSNLFCLAAAGTVSANVKDDPELPKLRMAPRSTTDEWMERIEREKRAEGREREMNLERSLAPFRVGSVPYLNAVPLTRGLEDEIIFEPPSQLAEMLRERKLDAALLSITEVLFSSQYDILDGIAIASLGEVFSVFLAHTIPLEKITTVYYDSASLTSVNLLRVLFAERGLKAEIKPLNGSPHDHDVVLLIGNPAIDFRRKPHRHEIWDLGAAWFEMTKLPFVYAVWAIQRDKETETLRRILREAKDFGLDTLDYLIENRTDYDRSFRKDYLGWHIHYHLGTDEKRGVAEFVRLLKKYSGREVHEPHYVA